MRRIAFGIFLLLLTLCTGLALRAQQPSSSKQEVFAGKDPLAGTGSASPLPTSGPCVPPRNSNWQLAGQDNLNCYWYSPYSQRINGYVTSINNVGALQKFYVKCGADPFDGTKVICQNPGDDRPGAPPSTGPPLGSGISATGRNGEVFSGGTNGSGGTLGPSGGPSSVGGSTASTGNYRRQPVQVPADPCHPNYNMSTAAGRAAAQQNAAQDQQACNEERCKHNPELSFCTTIVAQVPPGTQGLNPRVPAETDPKPIPIVPGPAAPGPQPRRAGPPVPGPVMPTPVPAPPASAPPAATPPLATPPPVNPGPPQLVNLWKGEFKCDGKNCVFVDQNGHRWAGPQVFEDLGGVYQIDPNQFQVIRIRTSNIIQSLATYRLIKLLPGTASASPTTTRVFNMLP